MAWVLQGNLKKKMEKVVIEEFDCCHSFIESCVRFILPLNERKFVHVTHLAGEDKFFILFPLIRNNSILTLITLLRTLLKNLKIGMIYLNIGMLMSR